MKATRELRDLGQSLWLDNITRNMLGTGLLERYINEYALTGLTSNPTIFDHAIRNGNEYDGAIKSKLAEGKSGENLFFELALEDLTQAADLFRPVYERTSGVDGWVSLEVSPLLAHDTQSTIAEVKDLHARAQRPNLLIKIPGTSEGSPAIEEAIFAGIPVNITLLFSDDQYLAAADAFMRGVERRIAAGLSPNVGSVASIFISRWDVAVAGKVPEALSNQLGIAMAKRAYIAYLGLLSSPRWMRAYNAGARPQRLLWASTGTKDPKASDVLYVKALAAPFTVNTMPEGTLHALAEHGVIEATMPADGGDCEEVLARFARAGIDVHALSAQLQDEGAKSFVNSWNDLMDVISSKCAVLNRGVEVAMKSSVKAVLAVDVGGSSVKILVTGQSERRSFLSGPKLTPGRMVAAVKELSADWVYDVVSIGYPGPVASDRPIAEPYNLGCGWVGFDFGEAFGCPVKVMNDAAMQALGSYEGGKMLFLGLGTGLGSAVILEGIVEPMELGHLPYKKGTYEDYVGRAGLERHGKKRWRRDVADVVTRLIAALEPDDTVLGGGNVKKLEVLPPHCRAGDNANAFRGGFRLWEETTLSRTAGLAPNYTYDGSERLP